MQRWIKSRTRLAHSWIRPAKAMRFCAAKLKRFWLHVNEQAASLKRQLLVSRRGLFKMGKLIRSSVRRSATTKFLNGSAPAGWAKSIWPPTLQRAARPRSNSCPLRFTGDAERLKRFQQEAHAVVGLNHPNILTVYEIGEDHSTHYIASELIEGETLRQRLMRGPNPGRVKLLTSRSKWRVRSPPPTKRELSIATSSRRTSCSGRTDT